MGKLAFLTTEWLQMEIKGQLTNSGYWITTVELKMKLRQLNSLEIETGLNIELSTNWDNQVSQKLLWHGVTELVF